MNYNEKVLNRFRLVQIRVIQGSDYTMDLDFESLGKRVRAARMKKGYSQEKLAEILEISQAHVGHIESGRATPSLPTFVRLANALGTTTDALLFDSLQVSLDTYDLDFKELLQDCTPKQRAILLRGAGQLKAILQDENV